MNNYSLECFDSSSPIAQDTLDAAFWKEIEIQQNSTENLYHAVCNGMHTDMHVLISQGADVNKKDVDGNSLVYIASIRGYLDVLKILVSYFADVEAGDVNGCKPLYAAVLHNQMDVVKYLVQIGADLEPYSSILMHNAAIKNDTVLISLLNNRGVDVNITNNYGCAALHYAAQHEQLDAIKWLVLKGANIDIRSHGGSTALNYAMVCEKFYSIVLLCSLGANIADEFWFFKMNNINQIFLHGSLAERLSAALNVYNTFFKSDKDFKHNLLNIISDMAETYQQKWDYNKIRLWLEDKDLGSLREVIYQTDNLLKSYLQIKDKLKKSKIVENHKVQNILGKSDFDTLLDSLNKYQFELIKKSLSFDEVKIQLPSLLRVNNMAFEKGVDFTLEELAIVSNLKISDLLKMEAPLSDTEELSPSSLYQSSDGVDILNILDLCSPFYFLDVDYCN